MVDAQSGDAVPPRFLRLAAHPVRWQLLRALARGDRRVGELSTLAGRQQSLVSYHLRQLRDGGLVSIRRSSADRRDSYYALDLPGCHHLLAAAVGALHPGLAATPPPRRHRPADVLFLCTGNSARSPMAEALAVQLSGGAVRAVSAGSLPKPLHPNAVRVMRSHGIDLSAHRSKHLETFAGQRFDLVVSLCDRVREACPEFPGALEQIHWSIPNPADQPGSDQETLPTFEAVAAELTDRIRFLLAALDAKEREPCPTS